MTKMELLKKSSDAIAATKQLSADLKDGGQYIYSTIMDDLITIMEQQNAILNELSPARKPSAVDKKF